ncbi:unnamed protein product [Cochlearia groenlandica]
MDELADEFFEDLGAEDELQLAITARVDGGRTMRDDVMAIQKRIDSHPIDTESEFLDLPEVVLCDSKAIMTESDASNGKSSGDDD